MSFLKVTYGLRYHGLKMGNSRSFCVPGTRPGFVRFSRKGWQTCFRVIHGSMLAFRAAVGVKARGRQAGSSEAGYLGLSGRLETVGGQEFRGCEDRQVGAGEGAETEL